MANSRQFQWLSALGILDQQQLNDALAEAELKNLELCDVLLGRELIDQSLAYQVRQKSGPAIKPIDPALLDQQLKQNLNDTGPSSQFGQYQLKNLVGQGGMGSVFSAIDTTSADKQWVAIKTLNVKKSDSVAFQRFKNEAETMMRFDHPHIVKVYKFAEDSEIPYMVMDLLIGGSLKTEIEMFGRLEGKKAAGIIHKICQALDYAHRRAVLHRDLKPGNILFGETQETVCLSDFGIAKSLGHQSSQMTLTGQVVGTPAYMSPEQVQGRHKDVEAHSDIFSIGIVLYECITGSKPFEGQDHSELAHKIVHDDPVAPRRMQSDIDLALELICLKCLEKSPVDRYSSARELANDLQCYLENEPISARAPTVLTRLLRWRRRHRTRLAKIVFGLVLIFIFIASIAAVPPLMRMNYVRGRFDAFFRADAFSSQAYNDFRQRIDQFYLRLNAIDLKYDYDDENRSIAIEDPAAIEAYQGLLLRIDKLMQSIERQTQDSNSVERVMPMLARRLRHDDLIELRSRFLRGLKADELKARLLLLKASLFARTDNLPQEQLLLSRVHKLDSRGDYGASALLRLSKIFHNQGQFQRAIQCCETILRWHKSNKNLGVAATLDLIFNYLAQGRYAEGFKVYRKLKAAGVPEYVREDFEQVSGILEGLDGVMSQRLETDGLRATPWLAESETLFYSLKKSADDSLLQIYQIGIDATGQLSLKKHSEHRLPRMNEKPYFRRIGRRNLVSFVADQKNGERRCYIYELFGTDLEQVLNRRLEFDDPQPGPRVHVQAFGDINADGDWDIVLADRFWRRFLYLSVPWGGSCDELMAVSHSKSLRSEFIDLNGDGIDDLVTSCLQWRHFGMAIYQGEPAFVTQFSRPWFRRFGSVTDFTTVRDSGMTHLLLTTDRSRGRDIGVVYGPDLSPQFPDALWRLTYTDLDYTLKALKRESFEARDDIRLKSVSLLKGTANSALGAPFISVEKRDGSRDWLMLLPYHQEKRARTLKLKAPGRIFAQTDLDGDGDFELLCRDGDTLTAFGLVGKIGEHNVPVKPQNTMTLDEDQFTLAVQLIESGEAAAGEQILKALLAETAKNSSKAGLILYHRARALIQLEHFTEAASCLEFLVQHFSALRVVAQRSLLQLLNRAQNFERAHEVVSDLLTNTRLSDEQRRYYLAQQVTLEQLARMQERLHFCKSSQNALAMVEKFETPLGIVSRPGDDAIHFRTRGTVPSRLQYRVKYRGGPFRLRGEFRVQRLDFNTGFRVTLDNIALAGKRSSLEFSLRQGGSGDPISWRRGLQTHVTPLVADRWVKFSQFQQIRSLLPRQLVAFSLLYRPDIRAVFVEYRVGEFRYREVISAVLIPGDYQFGVGTFVPGKRVLNDPRRIIDIKLNSLVIETFRRDIELVKPAASPELKQALALVRHEYDKIMATQYSGRQFELDYYHCLASIKKQGKSAEEELRAWVKRDPARAFERLSLDFAVLPLDCLKMIGQTLDFGPRGDFAGISGVLRQRHSVELELFQSQQPNSGQSALVQGLNWSRVGSFREAYQFLKPLIADKNTDAIAALALLHWRRFEFNRALELFDMIESEEYLQTNDLMRHKIYCQYILRNNR